MAWKERHLIEDGYRPSGSDSMNAASMALMRDHGVRKEIYSESDGPAHKTAKGSKVTVRIVKAPGFGPKGVLPFTISLKLRGIGGVLPPYDEVMPKEQELIDICKQENDVPRLDGEKAPGLAKHVRKRTGIGAGCSQPGWRFRRSRSGPTACHSLLCTMTPVSS
ncbi:hypothetical protein [Pectobacterium odoriferum]|uniref:hypothetical protein n=1 Tax=Pectobacterium odoriferum TaxID=78398 RepID=UPI003D9A5DD8